MSATVTALRRPGRPSRSNEELLDLALDLFLEHGFERTSIDAIAAAAGMAKRTVYLRYGDKAGLFKAALKRAIEEWIVPVERLRAAETDNLEDSLLRIGQLLVANIMSPAGMRLMRLTNAESGRHPELGAFALQQGTHPTVSFLADLFRRRIGRQVDAVPAADAFLYLVVGGPSNSTAWGVVHDAQAIDHHTRYAVQLFLHGLLAPPHGDSAGHLEKENVRLKQLLAEAMLDMAALKRGGLKEPR